MASREAHAHGLRALRWALVPLTSLAAAVAGVASGFVVRGWLENWCPWATMRPGDEMYCPVPLWASLPIHCAAHALAEIAFVRAGAATAPSRSPRVPWALFAAGATLATAWATLNLHGAFRYYDDWLHFFGRKGTYLHLLREVAAALGPLAFALLAGAVTARSLTKTREAARP